jgi:hypothetical protein
MRWSNVAQRSSPKSTGGSILRQIIFISALLLLSSNVAQGAQRLPDGVRDQPVSKFRKGDPDDSVRLMNAYARCVASNRPKLADQLLGYPLLSPEQNAAVRKNIGGVDSCMNRVEHALRIKQPAALMGGMAEERFLTRFGKLDDIVLAAGAKAMTPRSEWGDFALCVVHENSSGSRALIQTKPVSPEETTAVRALAPDLGPCWPAGSQLTLDKFAVRSYVAIGLYLAGQASTNLPAATTP